MRELRVLWAAGHSTAEIGRRLGVSKNAVVGKAHRMDLGGRPSPIRRSTSKPDPDAIEMKANREIPKVTSLEPSPMVLALAPGAITPPAVEPPPSAVELFIRTAHVPASPKRAAAPPRLVAEPVNSPDGPVACQCQWFEGKQKPWWQCMVPAVRGGVWCEEHYKEVYVKVRHRDNESWAA